MFNYCNLTFIIKINLIIYISVDLKSLPLFKNHCLLFYNVETLKYFSFSQLRKFI